ncbi:hypothetical protein LTR49_024928 [Elasticomyces elasticus]|nr:hypothetical protein LTR49_024928 [Elasticomyces elasticus]
MNSIVSPGLAILLSCTAFASLVTLQEDFRCGEVDIRLRRMIKFLAIVLVICLCGPIVIAILSLAVYTYDYTTDLLQAVARHTFNISSFLLYPLGHTLDLLRLVLKYAYLCFDLRGAI